MFHLLHTRFVLLLPRIEAHARIHFREIRCAAKRADCIAEVVALSWKWFLTLEKRGRDATQFVSAIATFATRAVKCGRRVAGMSKAKDAMNGYAQHRHGFTVEKLPDVGTLGGNSLAEALMDNTMTPPPDAAAFRLDFPRWLASLSDRDRRLAQHLMVGERPLATARRFRLSPARVSQLRRELCEDWERFHGDCFAAVA